MKTIQQIHNEAVAYARTHRGQMTAAEYAAGGAPTRVTPERAYAAMLEDQPEAYAAYRAQHNARTIVATLEAAGVRIVSR